MHFASFGYSLRKNSTFLINLLSTDELNDCANEPGET